MVANLDLSEGYTGENHPELYQRPQRSNPLKEGQLSQEELEQYDRDGFILVEKFFTPEELEPVRTAMNGLVTDLADKLFNAGKIKNKYDDLGLFKQLIMLEKEWPGAHVLLLKTGRLPEAFHSIASNPRMLNLLEDFLGPDISFSPVWNLRSKIPSSEITTVPWHQDNGYFDLNSYTNLMMTAWIPLLDTNEKNGTLQLVRKAHADARVAKHTCCAGPTWYVQLEEEDIEKEFNADMKKDIVTLNVPYGSFILFNNFTPHRSLMNHSDIVRWSLDFRWQKAGTPDGLWGLKNCCVVRSSDSPDMTPDWDSFDAVDRHVQQIKSLEVEEGKREEEESYFSKVISGPWMKKWEIVNHNQHTDAFFADTSQINPNVVHG